MITITQASDARNLLNLATLSGNVQVMMSAPQVAGVEIIRMPVKRNIGNLFGYSYITADKNNNEIMFNLVGDQLLGYINEDIRVELDLSTITWHTVSDSDVMFDYDQK